MAACSVPLSRDSLRNPIYSVGEPVEIAMNVEAAILCFEEAGPKMMVDFANVTQTQLYPTLGKGFVMFGSGDLLYGIIDLTKLGPETTKVEGWGSGTAANYFVAPAVDFLRQGPDKCPVLGGETK